MNGKADNFIPPKGPSTLTTLIFRSPRLREGMKEVQEEDKSLKKMILILDWTILRHPMPSFHASHTGASCLDSSLNRNNEMIALKIHGKNKTSFD